MKPTWVLNCNHCKFVIFYNNVIKYASIISFIRSINILFFLTFTLVKRFKILDTENNWINQVRWLFINYIINGNNKSSFISIKCYHFTRRWITIICHRLYWCLIITVLWYYTQSDIILIQRGIKLVFYTLIFVEII